MVVERAPPGFKVGKEEKKLGIIATACVELSYTDCEVPIENRIGNEGEGYKVALSTLDGGRIGIAAQAVGIAQGAFEEALKYSQQRMAFGHPISNFQAIQFMLADMADRKSTRLNSSHDQISYAVFCLKKKKPLLPRHQHITIRTVYLFSADYDIVVSRAP